MAKGLRFFGTDFNNIAFGGTPSASSSDANAQFAFDGLTGTRWISSGEGTDGDDIDLEMDWGFNRTIDCAYVYNTNIEDIDVEYWDGAVWQSFATISQSVKSPLLNYVFFKLASPITATKIRIVGSDTIIPNQQKYVTLFMAFQEIGQFAYFPDFSPSFIPKQNVFQIDDGRGFVIERGETFNAKIDLKSHVKQTDIDLAETLLSRKEPFFIWPNGGDDTGIFRFSFRPFRFQDIFKVTVVGSNNPTYTKNYYKAGYNNNINLIEVV